MSSLFPDLPVSLVNCVVQLTSYPETIEEEESEAGSPTEDDLSSQIGPPGMPDCGLEAPPSNGEEQSPEDVAAVPAAIPEDRDAVESQKRRRLEQAGIKVMPAAQRFARLALPAEGWPGWPSACLQVWILASKIGLLILFPQFLRVHHISGLCSRQVEIDTLPWGMSLLRPWLV